MKFFLHLFIFICPFILIAQAGIGSKYTSEEVIDLSNIEIASLERSNKESFIGEVKNELYNAK